MSNVNCWSTIRQQQVHTRQCVFLFTLQYTYIDLYENKLYQMTTHAVNCMPARIFQKWLQIVNHTYIYILQLYLYLYLLIIIISYYILCQNELKSRIIQEKTLKAAWNSHHDS